MTDTPPPATAADLERLLERLADAEQDYENHDGPPMDDPVVGDALQAAHRLVDHYRKVLAALHLRTVEAETGTTIGATIAGLDIHVRDDGADWISVCVNAEDATAGRDVRIESWDGMSWEHALREAQE